MPATTPSTLRRIGHLIDPRGVTIADLLIRPRRRPQTPRGGDAA